MNVSIKRMTIQKMLRLLIVAAILTLGVQGISAKGIADKEILSKISQYDGYTRDVRRHLHLYP